MIESITIPDEALEGYCRHRYGTDTHHLFNEKEKEVARRNTSAACIAMLRAWPGMEMETEDGQDDGIAIDIPTAIILPLPKEQKE